ncbi:CoA transferase subunit A [Conexibacter sp. CPCC 206217]|uniref:CoA transferase subunit A n=1 Tax=Conexibacter sp. CPCC 206217 TaxID=3064574 RepID=UPI0027179D5E|nr:CoA-transferase [Conexibacter sp. CPCC 206217]MDO8211027.1 CoA-transferase [Conexibacter sp. CPCC 206217]
MTEASIPIKALSLSEAAALIPDGAELALGGHTLRRHPMALIHELIRQGRRELRLLGWNNGIDVELLVAAGAVASVETSCVSLSQFGLGPAYRRAAQSGRIAIVDHSETTAIDMFRGAAQGVPFTPTKAPLGSGMVGENPRMRLIDDPFTGERHVAVQAVRPQFAVIHAHYADRHGNVLLDGEPWGDNSMDELLARAAQTLIVTVEQLVSDDFVLEHPELTLLPRRYVAAVAEAPFGAHPCCCDSWYDYDGEQLAAYAEAARDERTLEAFLDRWVRVADHDAYLAALTPRRLFSLRRAARTDTAPEEWSA